jgi:hypothetical protein
MVVIVSRIANSDHFDRTFLVDFIKYSCEIAKLALRKNSATGSLRAAGQILLYPASKFLLTDGPTS